MYGFDTEEQARAFYTELDALLDRHVRPLLDACDHTDAVLDGYNPDAPTVRTGIVIGVLEQSLDGGWENIWRSSMPGTGSFRAFGIAKSLGWYFDPDT